MIPAPSIFEGSMDAQPPRGNIARPAWGADLMMAGHLGRYEILGEIGRGAMGCVYRGLDPLVGREVAIKTVELEQFPRGSQNEVVKRFRREAQAAGKLTHPNIVTIFDVGESYFVMELIKGETLQRYLRMKGHLVPEEMLGIVAPLAGALDYAHACGVVHRDVKPGNIMITDRGVPKLMDFGLAHLEATVLTKAGQSLGSPAYMSPEQIQGHEPTSKADLYSLAVVTYELLTGSRPFAGKNITTLLHEVVHAAPVPPRHFNDSLPPRYDDLFARALAKEPDRRFPDAAEFVAELNLKELEAIASLIDVAEPRKQSAGTPREAFHEQKTVDVGPRPSASATERRGPRKRLRVFVAAASSALLAGAALLIPVLWSEPPRIRIESVPSGATVWLDEREIGTTPLDVEAATSPFTLTLAKEGFVPAKEELTLESDEATDPIVFALQPARASLFLTSTPSPASIFIDGNEVGQTPIADLTVAEGARRIEVRHPGYRTWTADIEARLGESLHLSARLKRNARPKPKPSSTSPPPAPEPRIAELGDPGVGPPEKISGEFAHYPELARRRRISGVVTVEMVISESGVPQEPSVIESGGAILDEAVLAAVREWRFAPATRNGVPVPIRWRVRQHFRLE